MDGSYAGVDWASDKHDVLVSDAAGEKLLAARFAHDEKGLQSLCRQLVRLKVRLVAIERPDGLLVERLLDAGLRVLALHPNQVAATRDRFRVSGGKSDGFDAFCLCELARTDHHRFRVLEPDADATKRMGSLIPSADIASLTQLRSDGSPRDVIQLSPGRDITVGREQGDWTFPYDPSMSGIHAKIRSEDADFVLIDADSRNGVAVAARGDVPLRGGSRVLLGDKLLRLELPGTP